MMDKKIILILIFAVQIQACSSGKPVELFLKTEIKRNKEKNIRSLLSDKKNDKQVTLDIYAGREITSIGVKAKSFRQTDYDYLMKRYCNDTAVAYWNEADRERFTFSELVLTKDWMKKMLPQEDSIKYLYNVSASLYTKGKRQAIFSILITSPPVVFVDEYLVIMKKENGKWMLLEKVYSSRHRVNYSNQ